MLNLIHGHLKWTTQVGAGNTLRNDTTFSHRDRGTSSQLHTAHALEDMRECLAATAKESWPRGGGRKGHQERATRYSICTLSARAVTTGPDVPKATTRQDVFSGLCLSLPRASGSSYLQHPGGLPGFCLLASVWVLATSDTALQSSACLVGFVLLNHLLEEELFDGRLTPCQNTIR